MKRIEEDRGEELTFKGLIKWLKNLNKTFFSLWIISIAVIYYNKDTINSLDLELVKIPKEIEILKKEVKNNANKNLTLQLK